MQEQTLINCIRKNSTDGFLTLEQALKASNKYKLSLAEVEKAALQNDVLPTRYLRNGLSCSQQLRLFCSKITIIGCGGLGGAVAESLARIGFGNLRLVDPDCFEEHNLNRQRFATAETLRQWKVEAAANRLKQINPALLVTPVKNEFGPEDIRWGDVVVDGLDCGEKRLYLAELCDKTNRILIHAAVREWYGRVGIHQKDNSLLQKHYRPINNSQSQPPKVLAPTVSVIANLQVAELCKYLLGIDSTLTKQWLSCDLLDSEFALHSL